MHILRLATCLLPLALSTAYLSAQVRAVPDREQWYLTAGHSTYVIGVDEKKMVEGLYWGPELTPNTLLPVARMAPERAAFDGPVNTTPLEYPGWGAGLYLEPALKIDSPNGDRTLVLQYESARVEANHLEIVLKDASQPLRVHLHYQVFPEGVLARWSSVENIGTKPFHIEQAASGTLNLPANTDYTLSRLTGMWAGEYQLQTGRLPFGAQQIESRRGSTGHQANPWFSIGREGKTTENSGPVWFGELGWSGSWRLDVERTPLNLVRVTAGYNPFDFGYNLEPGKSLDTPHLYAGYTSEGNGEASRILHRFQLAHILPLGPDPKPRPIVFNSWEATGFHVSEAGQIALAEKAAKIGVERFVMDDGWFGQRKDDHAGLGDWYVNKEKFPNGLKPLIDRVHALGMSFGLWVEPEMVNPDSDLYRKHPDWAMHFPDRQRTEQRNQLLLNLANPEVKAYVMNWLDKLVTENDIAFLKWDYNRNWSEPGWEDAPEGSDQKQIYITYVQNLYDILEELRAKHPMLEIESCSGGGGRVDLGILRYTDEVWPSDNTDAFDRLSIQDGFSHAYTPQVMVAWVTDVPNSLDHRTVPLEYRFLVAMQGALGIGNDLNKFSDAEMALATKLTAFYKTVRTTVQHGDQYRLQSPPFEATQVQYVSRSGAQSVVFAYLHSQQLGLAQPRVQLQGLDPNAAYKLQPLDDGKFRGELTATGAQLMGQGIDLRLTGDFDSTAVLLTRQ